MAVVPRPSQDGLRAVVGHDDGDALESSPRPDSPGDPWTRPAIRYFGRVIEGGSNRC